MFTIESFIDDVALQRSYERDSQPYTFLKNENYTAYWNISDDLCTAASKTASSTNSFVFVSQPIRKEHRLIIKTATLVSPSQLQMRVSACSTARLSDAWHVTSACTTSNYCPKNSTSASITTKAGEEGWIIIKRSADDRYIEYLGKDGVEIGKIDINGWGNDVVVGFYGHNFGANCLEIVPDTDGLLRTEKRRDQMLAWIALPGVCGDRHNELAAQIEWIKAFLETKQQETEQKVHALEIVNAGLQKQVEDMSLGSAPLAASSIDSSVWLAHSFIEIDDHVISRVGHIDDKNYCFRATQFDVGSKLAFEVKTCEHNFMESLTFGVSIYSPENLSMTRMPSSTEKLKVKSKSEKWFVAPDILTKVEEGLIVCITRTDDKFVIKTSADKKEKTLFEVDSCLNVYPFFYFDACVSAIELKDFKIKNRKACECVICLKETACNIAKPCRHLLFCSDCFEGAVIYNDDSCPVCGQKVTAYEQFLLR